MNMPDNAAGRDFVARRFVRVVPLLGGSVYVVILGAGASPGIVLAIGPKAYCESVAVRARSILCICINEAAREPSLN